MKLCQDCRWIRWVIHESMQEGRCDHPKIALTMLDYVTGDETVGRPLCQAARTIGACKPEGLLWEAQE